MRSNKIFSTLFLILVALGLVYLGYKYLGKPDPSTEAGLTAEGFADPESERSVSDEFLETLTGLQELSLQGEVFQNPVFRDLRDSAIVLPDQAPGRNNPFAPVNFAAPRALGTSALATTTPPRSTTPRNTIPSSGSGTVFPIPGFGDPSAR